MNYFFITVITILTLVGCGGAAERKEVYLEKAKLSLEAGDLDKARIELKNVLQIDPNVAEAYFQLGDIYDLKKDYKNSFTNYSKAVELAPSNLEAQAKLGRFYLFLLSDIDKAIEKRDLILGKDATNVGGLLLKAGIFLKQNDIDNAKIISQNIFLMYPEHVENAIFLATLYLRDKEYEDSLNVYKSSIKENPKNQLLKSKLANVYQLAGKYEQAEKIYKEILKNDRELFVNHVKLAMFYREIGDIEKGEEVLRKAAEEDEEDLKRKMVLVEFIQYTKGNQVAIEALKKIIEKNPRMGDLRPVLAKLYMAEKNQDDAEKILKSTISDFSDDSIGIKSRVFLTNLYMQQGKLDAATSIIDDAVKISPNDSEVNFVKAKMHLVNKDYDGAIISLRTVIKAEPENIEAYFLLASAHGANGEVQQVKEIINRAYENNRTNTKGLIMLARYHAKNENSSELGKVIDNYLTIDPDNYEALSYKCSLLNERKMFSDLRSFSLRLTELYPDMPNGYIYSVSYLLAEGKQDNAISLLEDSYKKVKDNYRMLDLLVSFYVPMKNFDLAEKTLYSAIRGNGQTSNLYVLLARVKLASGKTEDAKISLLKAIEIKPDWNVPYLLLAKRYIADKLSQKAIEILQQGLTQVKADLKLSFELTKIYENLGDYNTAINIYEKAYEKHSDNIVLINNLAILLSEHGNTENSMKRAKELTYKLKYSDHAAILDTVGWVYYKAGDYADAVTILKTVIEKSPDVAIFNYHLGMALLKMGDQAKAKIHLSSSLSNNNSFPGRADAEVQLKLLR